MDLCQGAGKNQTDHSTVGRFRATISMEPRSPGQGLLPGKGLCYSPKSVVENVSEVRPDTGRVSPAFHRGATACWIARRWEDYSLSRESRSFLFDAVAEFWIGFHTPPISEERIIERTVIPGQGHFPFHPMQSLCQGAMVCVRHLMGIRLAVATCIMNIRGIAI